MRLLSVVVPCFNEEDSAPEFHRRMTAAAQGAVADYEIVFVDDGSTDRTWPILHALTAADPHVRR